MDKRERMKKKRVSKLRRNRLFDEPRLLLLFLSSSTNSPIDSMLVSLVARADIREQEIG